MINLPALISAVFTITIGLLFIDLVPLQEINVCKSDYQNSSSCPDVFFAQTYFTARTNFITAATSAGAEVETHVVYEEAGVQYTMETAFFRRDDSKRMLVHLSGTHGIEGYTGSAVQMKLLSEWNNSRKEGPSVLFVHAIDPYGMAHFRQFNEKNVDLDRNCLPAEMWKTVVQRDANITVNDEVNSILSLNRAPRFIDRYVFLARLVKAGFIVGLNELKRGLIAGQRHNPEGLFFGGKEEQSSISVLRKILNKYRMAGEEKSILIDIRTGFGSQGLDTIMVDTEEEEAVAKKVFSTSVQNNTKVIAGVKAEDDLTAGHISLSSILGQNSLFFTEIFGTVRAPFIYRDLYLENAANNYARGSYVHQVMKTWLRDSFYPQSIAYKSSVLKRGTDAFHSAWTYLASA